MDVAVVADPDGFVLVVLDPMEGVDGLCGDSSAWDPRQSTGWTPQSPPQQSPGALRSLKGHLGAPRCRPGTQRGSTTACGSQKATGNPQKLPTTWGKAKTPKRHAGTPTAPQKPPEQHLGNHGTPKVPGKPPQQRLENHRDPKTLHGDLKGPQNTTWGPKGTPQPSPKRP